MDEFKPTPHAKVLSVLHSLEPQDGLNKFSGTIGQVYHAEQRIVFEPDQPDLVGTIIHEVVEDLLYQLGYDTGGKDHPLVIRTERLTRVLIKENAELVRRIADWLEKEDEQHGLQGNGKAEEGLEAASAAPCPTGQDKGQA